MTYQDSCHLVHAQKVRTRAARDHAAIPGLRAARDGGAGPVLRQRGHLQLRAAGDVARGCSRRRWTTSRRRAQRHRDREPRLHDAARGRRARSAASMRASSTSSSCWTRRCVRPQAAPGTQPRQFLSDERGERCLGARAEVADHLGRGDRLRCARTARIERRASGRTGTRRRTGRRRRSYRRRARPAPHRSRAPRRRPRRRSPSRCA